MTTPQHSGRGRGIAGTICAVLFVILAIVSVPALWIHSVLLDDQRFAQLAVQVTTDPASAAALGDATSEAIVTKLRIQERLAELLPGRLATLAPQLTAQVEQGLGDRIGARLANDRFAPALESAIAGLHKRIVDLLRGQAPNATLNGSVLTLDVTALINTALLRLQEVGLVPDSVTLDGDPSHPLVWSTALTAIFGPEPPDLTQVELMDSQGLATASTVVGLLDTLALVLPLLAALALLGAVWLSDRRPRTTWHLMVALGIALFVVGGAVFLLTSAITDQIARPNAQIIVGNLLDAISASFVRLTLVVLLGAAALGTIAWMVDRREPSVDDAPVPVPVMPPSMTGDAASPATGGPS